jgi:hypothetical protein
MGTISPEKANNSRRRAGRIRGKEKRKIPQALRSATTPREERRKEKEKSKALKKETT